MYLETKRTIIRDYKLEDTNDVCQFYFDENTTYNLGHKPFRNEDEVKGAIIMLKALNTHFPIELKETGKVIGFIAINPDYHYNNPECKELGFAIAKQYRENGYMKEVISQIVSYLFDLGIKAIYANCYKENVASKKTLESCGFISNGESVIEIKAFNKKMECFDYILANPNL